MIETILGNKLGSGARRERRGGREFHVAPVTMIVPGVLAGSRGALYYPPDEVSRDPLAWNGVPLVVGHPTKGGVPVSARSPDVLEVYGVGHVFASNFDEKLGAEAWFDVEATRGYDVRNGTSIFALLTRGDAIEVSTGLFTDNEPAPSGAAHNGRSYQWIARNYRPDHLAVLIGQKGACSVDDGCGINVNEVAVSTTMAAFLDALALNEELTDDDYDVVCESLVENDWVTLRGGTHVFVGEDGEIIKGPKIDSSGKFDDPDEERRFQEAGKRTDERTEKRAKIDKKKARAIGKMLKRVEGRSSEERAKLASVTILGEKDLVRALPDEAKPKGGETTGGWLSRLKKMFTGNAVPGQVRSEVTGYYKKYGAGRGKGPVHEAAQAGYMVLTDLDRDLGKRASEEAALGQNPASWVEDEATWDRAKAAADRGTYEGDAYWAVVAHIYERMGGLVKNELQHSEDDMDRTQKVKAICTNCSCYKGKEQVLGNGELFSDGEIDKLHTNVMAARVNEGAVAALTKKLKLDSSVTVNAAFIENEMPAALKKAAASEAVEEEEEEVAALPEKKPVLPMMNAEQQWLASAPPGIRDTIKSAMKIERDAKVKLVSKLVGNVKDDARRQEMGKRFMTKNLSELEDLVSLIPTAPTANAQPEPTWFFQGAGGPPAIETNAAADEDDIASMTPPTTNWAELAKR
jgi:hypothetical protein